GGWAGWRWTSAGGRVLEGRHPRRGDGLVVVGGAPGGSDRTDHGSVVELQRDTAGEGDQPVVGELDVVQRFARLRHRAEGGGLHVEVPGGACLLPRDVDAAEPGPVHAGEGLEVA